MASEAHRRKEEKKKFQRKEMVDPRNTEQDARDWVIATYKAVVSEIKEFFLTEPMKGYIGSFDPDFLHPSSTPAPATRHQSTSLATQSGRLAAETATTTSVAASSSSRSSPATSVGTRPSRPRGRPRKSGGDGEVPCSKRAPAAAAAAVVKPQQLQQQAEGETQRTMRGRERSKTPAPTQAAMVEECDEDDPQATRRHPTTAPPSLPQSSSKHRQAKAPTSKNVGQVASRPADATTTDDTTKAPPPAKNSRVTRGSARASTPSQKRRSARLETSQNTKKCVQRKAIEERQPASKKAREMLRPCGKESSTSSPAVVAAIQPPQQRKAIEEEQPASKKARGMSRPRGKESSTPSSAVVAAIQPPSQQSRVEKQGETTHRSTTTASTPTVSARAQASGGNEAASKVGGRAIPSRASSLTRPFRSTQGKVDRSVVAVAPTRVVQPQPQQRKEDGGKVGLAGVQIPARQQQKNIEGSRMDSEMQPPLPTPVPNPLSSMSRPVPLLNFLPTSNAAGTPIGGGSGGCSFSASTTSISTSTKWCGERKMSEESEWRAAGVWCMGARGGAWSATGASARKDGCCPANPPPPPSSQSAKAVAAAAAIDGGARRGGRGENEGDCDEGGNNDIERAGRSGEAGMSNEQRPTPALLPPPPPPPLSLAAATPTEVIDMRAEFFRKFPEPTAPVQVAHHPPTSSSSSSPPPPPPQLQKVVVASAPPREVVGQAMIAASHPPHGNGGDGGAQKGMTRLPMTQNAFAKGDDLNRKNREGMQWGQMGSVVQQQQQNPPLTRLLPAALPTPYMPPPQYSHSQRRMMTHHPAFDPMMPPPPKQWAPPLPAAPLPLVHLMGNNGGGGGIGSLPSHSNSMQPLQLQRSRHPPIPFPPPERPKRSNSSLPHPLAAAARAPMGAGCWEQFDRLPRGPIMKRVRVPLAGQPGRYRYELRPKSPSPVRLSPIGMKSRLLTMRTPDNIGGKKKRGRGDGRIR